MALEECACVARIDCLLLTVTTPSQPPQRARADHLGTIVTIPWKSCRVRSMACVL
jgi:hypothetical protein